MQKQNRKISRCCLQRKRRGGYFTKNKAKLLNKKEENLKKGAQENRFTSFFACCKASETKNEIN